MQPGGLNRFCRLGKAVQNRPFNIVKETTMARNDALLKLHKRLVDRRNSLRAILAREVADLNVGDTTGDEADAAFDSGAEEVSSSLAEIEARELNMIEKAIAKLKGGTYGLCEHCEKKI